MRTVVELAGLRVCFYIRHQATQLHRGNVMQAKLLKAWRVNQCGCALGINPVQRCTGCSVLAGVQGLRDFSSQYFSLRDQQVGQTAFSRA